MAEIERLQADDTGELALDDDRDGDPDEERAESAEQKQTGRQDFEGWVPV